MPPASGSLPKQEPGTRPSRALGYSFTLDATVSTGALHATFVNDGTLGVQVQVRPLSALPPAPMSYTTGAGDRQEATWAVGATYDLAAHGPDGFYRRWAGTTAKAGLEASLSRPGSSGNVKLDLSNGPASASVTIKNAYGASQTVEIGANQKRTVVLATSKGWYDLALTSSADPAWARQFAGRLHDGKPGISDPQLSR